MFVSLRRETQQCAIPLAILHCTFTLIQSDLSIFALFFPFSACTWRNGVATLFSACLIC